MAWLGIIIFIYMDTQEHTICRVWIHFIPTSLYPRREENIWSELESNPGPLVALATALTTRPWLLGLTGPSSKSTDNTEGLSLPDL